MTLVEVTYELQSPLTQDQLKRLAEFSNTYGLRRWRCETYSARPPSGENLGAPLGWAAPKSVFPLPVSLPCYGGSVTYPSVPLRGRSERTQTWTSKPPRSLVFFLNRLNRTRAGA